MFYRQSVTTGCGTSAIAKTRSLSKGFHNCTASPRGGSITHIPRDSIPDSMNLQNTFLSQMLQPRVLWIGCSDSSPRESAAHQNQNDQSLELRNLGNMIIEGDLSCETMIKHAVVDLRVKDIVVCGHYGCRIVRSSSRDGLQGPWSRKLDSLHSNHEKDLSQLPLSEQDGSFVKFNVLDQLRSLRAFPEVSDAIALGSLRIHGVVYDPESNTSHRLLE